MIKTKRTVMSFDATTKGRQSWLYIHTNWLKGDNLVICLLITLMGWNLEKTIITCENPCMMTDVWKKAVNYTSFNISYLETGL